MNAWADADAQPEAAAGDQFDLWGDGPIIESGKIGSCTAVRTVLIVTPSERSRRAPAT